MLQPKKMKFRKAFRGKNRGLAFRGSDIAFGEFGLKAQDGGVISSREIEAARKKITYVTSRTGKYWVRVFPHIPITKKPVGVKMGSGKGAVEAYVAKVRPGTILFELGGVTAETAKDAFKKAGHKLSIQTLFVQK